MGHDTVSFDLQFLHDKMPEKTKKVITLSLEEKVKLIQRYEAKKSTRSVGEEFGVSKDQVRRIWAKRSAIEEEFRTSPASKRRRLNMQTTGNEEINRLTREWVLDLTARKMHVTGPMMQDQALRIAKELGISEDKFKVMRPIKSI